MSLLFSKLPLPPAKFDNNSNVICKPWQLPHLFERTVGLGEIASDRVSRHIAIEPKNNMVLSLQNELDKVSYPCSKMRSNPKANVLWLEIHGDIKAIHRNIGANNATVVSFFNILDAKRSFDVLNQTLSQKASIYYVKPSSVDNNDSEKVFVVFSSIDNRADLLNYDHMKHILRFGSICSISEARISRSCILLNVEYHDERHGRELKASLNCSFLEGAQIMVYNAVSNDEVLCVHNATHESLTKQATTATVAAATAIAAAAATKRTIMDTPLPSPLAETCSFFSADSFASVKYHPVPSLPPSPTDKPKTVEASPSSSCNTASDTIAVPATPPSPARNATHKSPKKKSGSSAKKAVSNSVDLDKIQTGTDKRTTFMIRNIPNKYTQQMLIDYVNTTHKNKYDFLYLRIDFQNKCNVGYAFINFIDPK
ncbi:hypothetical protein [Parasitella parasitica]|uniref:Mei2-like C-terminal RNA recognition motif domain-containing protein n=1 Tax=Parasitella parasitica TaxID=35722 RepID=A0A0B7NS37_9FUNG|nr:hypothetical protein [Parasitella parasitica]